MLWEVVFVDIVRCVQVMRAMALTIHERQPSTSYHLHAPTRPDMRRILPLRLLSASGDPGSVSQPLAFLLQGPQLLVAYAPVMIVQRDGF